MDAGALADLWDEVTSDFLNGQETTVRGLLPKWFKSYGRQEDVRTDGFCEPYLGNLTSRPRMVFLGLNPGEVIPIFQLREIDGRAGIFVDQLQKLGSYRAWAARWPYLNDSHWRAFIKARRGADYHLVRYQFMKNWYQDDSLTSAVRIDFELYPWHSHKFHASAFRIDLDVITEMVWQPIASLNAPVVFAFGKPWVENVESLGVQIEGLYGSGCPDVLPDLGEKNSQRVVVVGRTREGTTVIAEKHSGGAGPPSASKAQILREFLSARHRLE